MARAKVPKEAQLNGEVRWASSRSLDMTPEKKTRLKVLELRTEASRFQAGNTERASKLLTHAVRLEGVIAVLAR